MNDEFSTLKETGDLATIESCAALDFEPSYTKDEASELGGPVLSEQMVCMRVAIFTLGQSKAELVKGFGNNPDTLMETIDCLSSFGETLRDFTELNQTAIHRLICVASTIGLAEQCPVTNKAA